MTSHKASSRKASAVAAQTTAPRRFFRSGDFRAAVNHATASRDTLLFALTEKKMHQAFWGLGQMRYLILPDERIDGDDDQIVRLGLADEDTIKRITMVRRQ